MGSYVLFVSSSMFLFTEFRTRARYPILGNATRTPRSFPNAGHSSAVCSNLSQMYLQLSRPDPFPSRFYSHRQQPDYVSTVDKSGFGGVTHSRSTILPPCHAINDHALRLRHFSTTRVQLALHATPTEKKHRYAIYGLHTVCVRTDLSCRHEGRRELDSWAISPASGSGCNVGDTTS